MENEGDGSGWLISLIVGICGWLLIAAFWPKSLIIVLMLVAFLAGLCYPTRR